MVRAIHDAPSILERFTYGKEKYIAFFRATFLKHVQRDNVVYHGLAGHFFVRGIPHALKIRVTADLEARVREEMRRENISAEEARHILVKDDAERRRWSLHLYGMDTWDPMLYDMVLQIGTMSVGDVVDNILHAVRRPCFKTTPEGQRALDDLALSAQAEATLIPVFPKVTVHAKDGEVYVSIRGRLADQKATTEQIEKLIEGVEGAKAIHVNIIPIA